MAVMGRTCPCGAVGPRTYRCIGLFWAPRHQVSAQGLGHRVRARLQVRLSGHRSSGFSRQRSWRPLVFVR
eukprot:321744-Chlamydomonas_euryale.AAC.1